MDQKSIWINIVMFAIALIYFIIPPKKRNYFYGYRTFKSMKSEENFIKINKKCSQLLFLFVCISIAINLILYLLNKETYTEALMIGALALSILGTQIYILRNKKLN